MSILNELCDWRCEEQKQCRPVDKIELTYGEKVRLRIHLENIHFPYTGPPWVSDQDWYGTIYGMKFR